MIWRPNIRNHTFDRMGDGHKPLLDHSHFMAYNAFDFPRHFEPATNIAQHDKKLMFDILVPGFTKDNLEVSIEDDLLTVKGEKPHHAQETGVEYVVEEFSTDSFERQFKLSEDVSTDHIEAKCENGVLHIIFHNEKPKTSNRSHNIEVM